VPCFYSETAVVYFTNMRHSSPDFLNTHDFESKVDGVHTCRFPLQHFWAPTADVRLMQCRHSYNNLCFMFYLRDPEFKVYDTHVQQNWIKASEAVGLDSSTVLLLLQRLSQNAKFQKFDNNFKIKNLENCSTVFLHIGREFMYVKFREDPIKIVGGVAIWKSPWWHPISYTISSAGCS